MTNAERAAVLEMDFILREAQHVLADWLEPGVLSSGEAQERLLDLLDNPRLMSAQLEARCAIAEKIEALG
jgi:uncharacterized protein (DUF1778 family)